MGRSSLKSFLRNYYLTNFFYHFIFAYAIYNLLFSLRGLSVFQISLLISWWALAAMVLEIPTGALADSWSRRKMLILAPLFKSICFLIWFFAGGNFYLYALGFLFWSLGSAFISGTTESLLYDTLNSLGQKEAYEEILGRKQFYFHIALMISMIIGGLIASYDLDWAVLFSVAPLLFSSFFAFLLKEAPKSKSTGEIKYLEHIRVALKEVKTNKVLVYLLVYLLGISIFADLEEFDQLYYQLVKLPVYIFGLVGGFWSLLNALASLFAYKLKKISWPYYLFPFLGAVFLILVAFFPGIPMIGLLLLSYFITTPVRVLAESKLQRQIKSLSRATVTSMAALLVNLLGVMIIPVFGLIGKIWKLQAIYLLTAIFLLVFSFWTFRVKRWFRIETNN